MSETRWLQRAVDALDQALLLVNGERKIAYANAAAQRLFGYAPGAESSLLGLSVDRLVVNERRGELRNFEDVLGGGGARRVRSVLRREDGTRVDVTMALEPSLDEHGSVSAVSVRYFEAPQNSVRPPLNTSRPPLGMGLPLGSPLPPPLKQGADSARAAAGSSPTPALCSSRLPPSKSESRLSAARPPHEMLQSRLRKVQQNLEWLRERLTVPASIAPLDDTRERARTILAVEEACSLVSESVAMLEGEEQIPPAPRIPRM
jgi:PAS domain S-box-containing protein